MYKTITLSFEDGEKLLYTKNKDSKNGWQWICENHHGISYWNSKTGELLWYDEDENKYTYSQKVIE